MQFDMEGTFGDDYLYFYAESIDDEHSDADTAEILALLGLAPGSTILDAPCGHGRLSRRLAAAGMRVTGVDLTHAYLDLARADPKLAPDAVTYLEGDVRALPVTGPYDAVVCWLNSFGYYDDADCHTVLAEFHRVLRPQGMLMLVFQIGDEQGHRTDFRGTPVSVDWYRQQPQDLTGLLRQTGFELWTTAVREPAGSERVAQGYILARKQ